ncbi:protein of unknown function [Streptomyces murinus]
MTGRDPVARVWRDSRARAQGSRGGRIRRRGQGGADARRWPPARVREGEPTVRTALSAARTGRSGQPAPPARSGPVVRMLCVPVHGFGRDVVDSTPIHTARSQARCPAGRRGTGRRHLVRWRW